MLDNVINEIKQLDIQKEQNENANDNNQKFDKNHSRKLLNKFVDDDLDLKFNSESPSPNKSNKL